MSIVVREPQNNFVPAPEGLTQAVCVDVVDLGLVQTAFGAKYKVEIRWQTEEREQKADGTERPYLVIKRYTQSLHKKAGLRQDLEAWRGRKFSDEELKGFDLETLLGVNCQIQVIHNVAEGGKVYANIQAIMKVAKNATLIRPYEYTRVKDRETGPYHGQPADAVGDDDVPF